MTIELAEKRINLERIYSVPKMWKVIDELCSRYFTKISEGCYRLNEAMLGHASMSTTMIYLRTLEKSRKEGVSALSNTYQDLMSKDKSINKDS